MRSIFSLLFCFSLTSFATALPQKSSPLKIVTTFSILGDFVKEIGKDKVIISIVGPNSDTHAYQPTPKDVKQISDADLIFVNGLGFEGWIDRLIKSSGYKGKVVVATKGVTPILLNEPGEGLVQDPHAWNDVENVMIYIKNIYHALSDLTPSQEAYYKENYVSYLNQLRNLEENIHQAYVKIPKFKRKIITAHDAFGYYGKKYGVTFLAPVGTSTADEPSAKEMAQLVDEIKKHQIKIIFVENITNKKLIQQLSDETGAEIGPEIYSDALSEKDQPGGTYLKMMAHNTAQFVKAMETNH